MSALVGVGRSAAARQAAPAERTRELYERHGQRVFTFCYSRLRNREEAQDAAQTTFIYVMRSLERGVVPEFELAWLLKIAFNVCRGTRRSAGHRLAAANSELADVDELPDRSNPDGLEANERLEALRGALRSLPENQRRAILLREWQGLSYAEIADELGLTVGAVETLLFRARRNLTSRLEHVRGSFAALNLGTALVALRSLARGLLVKLALVGAAAAVVGLVPLVAEKALQARASGERVRLLAPAGPSRSAARVSLAGTAIPPTAPRSSARSTAPRSSARSRTGTAQAAAFTHRARDRGSGLTPVSAPRGLAPQAPSPAPATVSAPPAPSNASVPRSVGPGGSGPRSPLSPAPLPLSPAPLPLSPAPLPLSPAPPPAPTLTSALALPDLSSALHEALPSLLTPPAAPASSGLPAVPVP
ncbi:MAG TPA: sigma-70 family RNA polymerase sigma factor [Gaiellaceae bacterium]